MDLLEQINISISSLRDPEGSIFDFDKELELLNALKNFIIENINNSYIIENYKNEVEELKDNACVIENKKSELEGRIREMEIELDNLQNLMLKEILSKMRLLDYPEEEIRRASEERGFLKISKLREKVLNEFDMKFKIDQLVKDTPKKEVFNYSLYKI